MFEEALQARKSFFDNKPHQLVGSTMVDLAGAYRKNGQDDEATEMLTEAVIDPAELPACLQAPSLLHASSLLVGVAGRSPSTRARSRQPIETSTSR